MAKFLNNLFIENFNESLKISTFSFEKKNSITYFPLWCMCGGGESSFETV